MLVHLQALFALVAGDELDLCIGEAFCSQVGKHLVPEQMWMDGLCDSGVSALGTRTIMVPIANHDNNQHSFNENLRLQNLWDGIELMAALLTM